MSYRLPHLATLQDIESWGGRVASRSQLPNLMRRLILDEVRFVTNLEMPGDEDVDLSGYDGQVTSPMKSLLVPDGDSVWEFGASGDPGSKANKDYNGRTKDPLGVDMSATTFVFVTPQRWAGAAAWVKKRREEAKWKDVVVINSSSLLRSLEAAPNTHIWFSELIGIPSNAVMTLSLWWDKFAAPTRGLLTADLLLLGRQEAAARLIEKIQQQERGHTWVEAPSTDDVLAFVFAAIGSADPELRAALIEKSLVVFEPGALLFLDRTEGLLILVPFDESLVRQADLTTNHHVILRTSDRGASSMSLPGVPILESSKFLEAAGVEHGHGKQLARALNKSIEQFRYKLNGEPSSALVTEREGHLASPLLRRAWLLGAWDEVVEGDADAFETLVGKKTTEVSGELAGLASGLAPVFSNVGSAWRLFDGGATFRSLAKNLSRPDLQQLELVIQAVLGAVDPRLDLPRQDRWAASLDGKARAHSSDLRKGLARTLAMFGASSSEDEASSSGSLQGWSELIVRALLQRANDDSTGKLWESLLDVLPILAEAAPDVFIEALQSAIASDGVLVDKLFTDDDTGFFSQTSPHTYLLWALERIAWSPDYFGAAARQMKRLASLDPGGKTTNRPLTSLVGVLSSWHPQTGATLRSRIAVLRTIASNKSDLDWMILMALMPDSHAWAMDSGGPEFRDWRSDAESRKITMQDLFEFVAEVVDLSVQAARELPVRYGDLVEKLDDMSAEQRGKIVESLKELPGEVVTEEVRDTIWNRLGDLIRRHREYADTDWALPATYLETLEEVRNLFVPASPVPQVVWLFSSMPELGNVKYTEDHEAYQTELERLRLDAIRRVIETEGKIGLTELAELADAPYAIGYSAARSGLMDDELSHFAALMIDESAKIVSFSSAFVGALLASAPNKLIGLATAQTDEKLAARILLLSDDLELIWTKLELFGRETEDHYWADFNIYGRGDFDLVNDAATQLAKHGRIAVALDLLALYSHRHEERVDPELVNRLLKEFLSANDPEARVLSQYDLTHLIAIVRKSDKFTTEQIALLEWAFLPALDSKKDTKTLQQFLSDSPEFFVTMISYVYRRKNPSDFEEAKIPENLTSNAWNLLRKWAVIPGSKFSEGEVDFDSLNEWVTEARVLLIEADRLSPGEAHIGEVLARSKTDEDGTWPTRPVRDFIEADTSEIIARNFTIGVSNSRGITSRSVGEGGAQERVLAQKYKNLASKITDEWPRTASLLRKVEKSYLADAKRQDEEAARDNEGFDY